MNRLNFEKLNNESNDQVPESKYFVKKDKPKKKYQTGDDVKHKKKKIRGSYLEKVLNKPDKEPQQDLES